MTGTFNHVHLIRQIDLFTLKLFLTVVEEGQVGRAAARENIAASAATKRIQDLEEIVGARLFERTPRGVVATAAGQVLARHLVQLFGTLEEVRREFGMFTEGVRGTIRVASTGGILFQYLAREIADFAKAFPMIDIDVRENLNHDVVKAVVAGDVDVGVFVGPPGDAADALDCAHFRSDRLIAVLPRRHPLADRQSLKVVELFEHNLIAISPLTNLMGSVRRAAAAAGVEFRPKYSVSSVYAATGLVRVGQGVTIQPENMLSMQDEEWVRTVPLDEPWAVRRLEIGIGRGRALSVAARNFVAQLTARPD
jgi:DNA-binding transcriptional LysR family regulator